MRGEEFLNDRYRLTDVLGVGGMSVVWRAHDELLNRTVAVKLLAPRHPADGLSRGRMLAEARSAAMLSHPNVTNVFDYGESIDASGQFVPFVVMELLTGPTLATRLVGEPLAPREILRICEQVASAVAAAHAHGLVHRDIKPSNVILTPAGAKVLDFGIAAPAGAREVETGEQLMGTPAYVAPERLISDDVSPAVDVFALGVLLYRLLTRDLPWAGESPSQALNARLTTEARPLPAIPDVPREVIDICHRCLERDPLRRPIAAEVAAVLAAAVEAKPAAAGDTAAIALPSPLLAPTGRRRKRRFQVAGAMAAAALAVLAVLLPAALSGDKGTNAEAAPVTAPSATRPGSVAIPGAGSSAAPGSTSDAGGQPGQSTDPAGGGWTSGAVSPGAPGSTSSPTQPTSGPAATTPAQTSSLAPVGESVSAMGGTIYVLCQGLLARITTVQPAAGYTVQHQVLGPASQVLVTLVSWANRSDIRARCGPQGLNFTVTETPQP